MEYKEWVPDEAVEQLTLKRALMQVEDPIKMAADLFKEALPISVMSLTHLAVHSENEGIRLNAARYVVERTMGTVSSANRPPEERPAWEKIFDSVIVENDKRHATTNAPNIANNPTNTNKVWESGENGDMMM